MALESTAPETTRAQRFDWAFALCFSLVLALGAALVFAHRRLPLVDWPEHLAQDYAVGQHRDPASPGARFYEPTGWFVPYQGFRWVHIVLARVTGAGYPLAGRLAWLVYLLGAPLASYAWLVRAGRDRWAALACACVLVEANMLWGFAPHCMGTALGLWGLVLARDLLARGGALRASILALVGVAAFFTHAQQTAWWALSCAALGLYARFREQMPWRRVLSLALCTAPGLALTLLYLLAQGWLDGSALRDGFGAPSRAVAWDPPWRALAGLPWNAGLTALGPAGALSFALALAALSWGALRVSRARPSLSPAPSLPSLTTSATPATPVRYDGPTAVLCALWLALTLFTPSEYRGQSIGPRFASAAVLALLWLAAPSAPRSARERTLLALPRALWTAAALLSLAWAHGRFAEFSRHTRALDGALARIEPGSRVASLAFEARDPAFALPVCLRLAAYAVSERSAMVSSGFTRTGVRYSPIFPPESLLVREVWHASTRGQPMNLARYAPHYDYVLVHFAPGPRARAYPFVQGSLPAGYAIERVYESEGFALWRITSPHISQVETHSAPAR